MRCAIVARFADRPERIIGVGRTPVHDPRRRTRHHGLQTLLSSWESTLFVRTKDPGAPRNQRVWRASLTPPTTSCSNTGRALRVRIKRTKYKDEAWRLLLW